ncbi:MAG: uroporphyrinogen decarboxylase family protein [Candidatus Omnitrophota bacterium]
MNYTPKQRMLNAYRGIFSDRYPVAPEFWYYYPARVMNVDMVQFEKEIPFWKALLITFKKYGAEGWGIVSPVSRLPFPIKSSFEKISESQYRQTDTVSIGGKEFSSTIIYDRKEPSWLTESPVKDEADVLPYVDMLLSPETTFDFKPAVEAHNAVGEDYLLELWLGVPFFDFIAGFMGFEKAAMYFADQDAAALRDIRDRYIESRLEYIQKACSQTKFESFFVGCGYSNNSLIGPRMWRRWDKPYLAAVATELHKHGRLLHVHIHGKCLETVQEFAEIGLDCVCPFERPPGGDVDGLDGLKKVRAALAGKVTVNGNVHTVETLIRGRPEKVRAEVQEIKAAFAGEPRLIIGTGDQVGRETPEENILAMIAEAKA